MCFLVFMSLAIVHDLSVAVMHFIHHFTFKFCRYVVPLLSIWRILFFHFIPFCMAAPMPTPTPTPTPTPMPPQPTPTPARTPTPTSIPTLPQLHADQDSSMWLIISGAVGIMIAIVLLIAHWRTQLQASEQCAGVCCTSLFPPPRRRRLPHPPPSPPPMAPEPADDVEMQCAETMPEPSTFEIEQILIEDLPYVSAFSKSRNGKRDILKATLHCRHTGPQACIGTAAGTLTRLILSTVPTRSGPRPQVGQRNLCSTPPSCVTSTLQ